LAAGICAPKQKNKWPCGGFEIPNSKPPFPFEKIENGGCVKVAHF
jgi:hypothetical protein